MDEYFNFHLKSFIKCNSDYIQQLYYELSIGKSNLDISETFFFKFYKLYLKNKIKIPFIIENIQLILKGKRNVSLKNKIYILFVLCIILILAVLSSLIHI